MTNLDQESLFSLELIVGQLHVHQSVECRIPAVAFRLLDFPTLLIYHIEPELAATIRSKLMGDHYWHVPAQLEELQGHKTGTYAICRGKSCLFRVSPNAVVSSLSSAPLYVMVVDMFPETPKLVGSCGVPLSACAHDLYNDIVSNGISVPAVRAEKKELDLYNLMGKKVGTILLGCRLLSLGAAMLSHIPTQNIIHVQAKEDIDQYEYVEEVPQSVSEAGIAAQQSTNVEQRRDNSEVKNIPEKTFTDSETQMEPCTFGSVGTQTIKQTSHTRKPTVPLTNIADDIITPNIICPPPLFYNSTVCKKTAAWHQENWSSVWHMADDGSNWSDDVTIRVEDLDDNQETACNIDFSTRVRKDKRSSLLTQSNNVRSDPATQTNHPGYTTGFPVLSALMAEILRFQGMNLVSDSRRLDADQEAQYVIQKTEKGRKLQKMNSVNAVEPKRSMHKCEVCANMLTHDKRLMLSKRRSSGPPVNQKPFFAGMTNTQRLRLAKTNPKLLRELEAKELQRKNEFRTARMKRLRQKENIPTGRQQNADEIDALKRIDVSKATEYVDESRESTARYKCPVPTPRTSKMNLTADHQLADRNVSAVDMSCTGTETHAVGHKRMEYHLSRKLSAEGKFTLVPVEIDSESDYSGQSAVTGNPSDSKLACKQVPADLKQPNVGSEDLNTEPVNNFGQTRNVLASVVLKDTSAGSSQLEASDTQAMPSLEDLGLRKIVDHYSGESDNDSVTENGEDSTEAKDINVECDSVEEGKKTSDLILSEECGKGVEPQLLHKVTDHSDVSEFEDSDPEYDNDFDDTPGRSLKTVSTMNSSASSIVDSAVRRRMVSAAGSREADANMKVSGQSWPTGRMGNYYCCYCYYYYYYYYYYFRSLFYWPIFLEINPGWARSPKVSQRRTFGIDDVRFFYRLGALHVTQQVVSKH